jgi:alpha-ketoglutarate-dependent taurine dioxygenase
MAHAMRLAAAPGTVCNTLHPVLGAEFEGFDIADHPDAERLAALRRALRAHLVLVLRHQRITPLALLAFTRQLGAPQPHPLASLTLSDVPEIVVEEPVYDAHDLLWHADLAWTDQPNRTSVLAFGASAAEGAVTEFSSLVAAYDGLSPWLKDRIEYLEAEHDHPRRLATGGATPRHPLVHVEVETGRRCLMPGGATARRIPGLPPGESDDLLHRLRCAATHPAVVFTHRWRPGDVVIWDNLAVLHRHGAAGRIRLLRSMVQGPLPVGPASLTNAWVSAG